MKPYELVIDHEACWGCRTCEVACKQEFSTAPGVQLLYVTELSGPDESGREQFSFRVNVCRHCDDPPCVDSCPESAISQRDDGIVVLDEEACSGCRSCIDSCPYGAIAFDEQDGVARKCNLCHKRVDNGLVPACADNVCLAHCIYFGDRESVENQRNSRVGRK
ncbi:4Fe-4S dicluster domain-containing protein [Desulforhopalus singaporensis]|uniref:Anaerobic dimethyl sulfoxide reductase subunit B (DMSO reductase iron-sulfur subunit) n=1 Tax=Desulforhopalus singaporensis TaxID=91360 RepID=A0A1H0ITL3_9BACT|nr:4Fe-4S dicluster domain-containing protein [Desulforhopalus singaporensis]SDO34739.1 anaerobic dimethyl sulfoxide reductase subunit B (DMSO reductase iron-sulfur subunit) [Desulforhopalus singaporensis]